MQKIEGLKDQANRYTQYQEIFKVCEFFCHISVDLMVDQVGISRYEELEEVYLDLFQKKTLWQSLHEWSALVDQWAECPFEQIDAEQVTKYSQFSSLLTSN